MPLTLSLDSSGHPPIRLRGVTPDRLLARSIAEIATIGVFRGNQQAPSEICFAYRAIPAMAVSSSRATFGMYTTSAAA